MIDVTKSLGYQVHLAYFGWKQGIVYDGMATGTAGHALRMEAIKVYNLPHYIQYRAHVSGKGWLEWVSEGQTAGTVDESRQMEALQFRFTSGAPSDAPHIFGRSHVSSIGWYDAKSAMEPSYVGTIGLGKQMEAIQLMVIVPNSILIRNSLATAGELNSSSNPPAIRFADEAMKAAVCMATLGKAGLDCFGGRVYHCALDVAALGVCVQHYRGGSDVDVGKPKREPDNRGDFERDPKAGSIARTDGSGAWLMNL